MKSIRIAAILLALTAPLAARAQDDPFAALRQFDYQQRKPVHAIMLLIQQAGTDRLKLAAIESGLVGVVQDPNATFAGKQEACRFLWEVGTARSVPALAKMLPDADLSNIARYALERNPDPSAAAALRAGLAKTHGAQQIGLINSVGDRADVLAVPELRKLAASNEDEVAIAAAAALGKIGTRAALAALRAIPNKRLIVHNAMLRCADRLASAGDRSTAISVYASLTAAPLPPVIRAGGVEGLARLHAPSACTVALQVARTPGDAELERACGHVAGTLTATADVHRAIADWPKLPAPAQTALLAAWGAHKEAAAVPVALAALKSEDADVRRVAIQACALIAGPPAVERLAEIAAGGEDAGEARECLARMSGRGVEPALLHAAQQDRPEVRVAVLQILSERSSPGAVDALLAAASGSDPHVAGAALKSLGVVAGPQQEPKLVSILVSTKSDAVRDETRDAIVAVAQHSGDRDAAAGALVSALSGASSAAQASILGALADVGGEHALDALNRAVTSNSGEVKTAAVTALANAWSDPGALLTLLTVAQSDSNRSLRVVALRGYLRIVGSNEGVPAVQRLEWVRQAMAAAQRPDEKRQAIGVLRDIRLSGAITLAAEQVDDPALSLEAASAVIYLASPQRRGNMNIPAVTGPEATAALQKVVQTVKDDDTKARAQKLLQG